jgi:hypothetical protein
VRLRAFGSGVAVVAVLAFVPAAEAKFRMTLALHPAAAIVGDQVQVVLTTDTTLPPDHRLRLVAVAPGVEMYTAIKSLFRAPGAENPYGSHAWFERVGAREWRATVGFTAPGRWLLVIPNWGPVGYALPPPVVRAVQVAPQSPDGCRVTLANGRTPPGERPSRSHHGNGGLFTALWPNGTILAQPQYVRPDGSIGMKFPWWRGRSTRGQLRITGRRLDAPAPALRADIPSGYGPTGFQATGLIFPTEGCWEVTGRAGKARLTFVTRVTRVPAATP